MKRTYVSPIDDVRIDYALWYPPDYDDSTRWPLIVFLHGSAEGQNWMSPTAEGASIPVRGARADLPFVVAFPLMRGSWSIAGLAEHDVLATIDDVQTHAAIDPDRIHLTGLSLGGFAAWRIACRYPDRFATLTTFCSGGEPELAGNLRHVPTRVYHGTNDRHVPVQESRRMVEALQEAKLETTYRELRGLGHVCWRNAYASDPLYEWMASNRRDSAPRRIGYRTQTLRHHRAYWASIESMLDPGKPASIDVFAPDDRQIHVHAENVARLALNPPKSIIPDSRAPDFFADGKPITPKRADGVWVLTFAEDNDAAPEKRPGLSGPIQDVFYDPFVIVIPGPAHGPTADVWKQVAQYAFAWAGSLVNQKLKVLHDDRVTPGVIASHHLICFGNPDSNAILAQAADGLPLTWSTSGLLMEGKKASPDIAGLAMIYPNPLNADRYIIVCSGQAVAVAKLATTVLRPPLLSRPPLEDLAVITSVGEYPLETPIALAEDAYHSMADPPDPRGTLFDRHWQLTPHARSILAGANPSTRPAAGEDGGMAYHRTEDGS